MKAASKKGIWEVNKLTPPVKMYANLLNLKLHLFLPNDAMLAQ